MSQPKSFPEVIARGLCQFITGDIKDGTAEFCPEKRYDNSSYCQHHHERCWVKPKDINLQNIPE